MSGRTERPPRPRSIAMRFLQGVNNFLLHPVLRPHDHWARGSEIGIRGTSKIHGDPEETRGAKGCCVGGHFLEVPAEGLFTSVDAIDRLKTRCRIPGRN